MKKTKIKRTLAALFSLGFLNACTIGPAFKGPGYKAGEVIADTKNNQVVVGLTYIQVGESRQKNAIFWDQVMRVYDSMEQHNGLIGYAIRRELLGDKGWTMSVWTDEESLNRFVQSQVHQEAIRHGFAALKDTRFARFTRHKDDIPLKWQEAVKILEKSPVSYHHH